MITIVISKLPGSHSRVDGMEIDVARQVINF